MLNMASTASIAGGLLKLSLLDLPLDEPARAMKHYEGTTAKDVKDAFERWIRTEDFVQIIRGPTPQ
jgi:predicted Zn-dependent peptidase